MGFGLTPTNAKQTADSLMHITHGTPIEGTLDICTYTTEVILFVNLEEFGTFIVQGFVLRFNINP